MPSVFDRRFDRVVWILSTGRTGTMALARTLDAAYEHVLAVHEPPPSRRLRIASNRYLCGRIGREDLVRKYRRARQRLFAEARASVYIESNNFLHGFLDVLDMLFDDARVLHVVRDPRTFIPSWINHGVLHGVKGLVGHWHPWWLLKPDRHPDGRGLRWRCLPPKARLAWFWNAVNTELNRGETLLGARYMRVRFEDLFFDGGITFRRVTAWMGLSANSEAERLLFERRYNAGIRKRCPRWEEWPEQERELVTSMCGPLMIEYGYAPDEPPDAAASPEETERRNLPEAGGAR